MDPVYGRPDQIALLAQAQQLRGEAIRYALKKTWAWVAKRR